MTLFYIRCVVAIAVFATFYSQARSIQTINICYADSAKAPLFLNARNEIPIFAAQTQFNILKRIDDSLAKINFILHKKTRQSCIEAIKTGEMDAHLSAFNHEKLSYAAFPVNNNKQPISEFALTRFSQCLLGNRRFHTKWGAREVFQRKAFSLVVPNGLFIGDAASEETFFIEYSFTQQDAVNQVIAGNADATLAICEIGNNKVDLSVYHKHKLAPVFPPLNTTTAYLAFSNNFYSKHESAAKLVWQQLAKQSISPHYAQLLQRNVTD